MPHVHTQNDIVESLINRIKLIARSLLQDFSLPITCWGHAVLHFSALIQLLPTAYHDYFPLQLVHDTEPNIFHLHVFEYAKYIPLYHLHIVYLFGPTLKGGYLCWLLISLYH